MQFECDVELPDMRGWTLVVSSVSVGNVGQLAMDVILATLHGSGLLSLVSQVSHPMVIPMAGSDPIVRDSTQLSTAMQLYTCSQSKLALLQLRSGLMPGSSGQWCADLVSWAHGAGVTRLVTLTSSLAHERQECQLTGSPFRYLATGSVSVPQGFIRLEPRQTVHGLPVDNSQQELYLPGSGIALDLYHLLSKDNMELIILSKFTEEGDNTRDGLELADYCNAMIHWSADTKYSVPHSWSSLFGAPAPAEMFW